MLTVWQLNFPLILLVAKLSIDENKENKNRLPQLGVFPCPFPRKIALYLKLLPHIYLYLKPIPQIKQQFLYHKIMFKTDFNYFFNRR